MAMTDKTSIPSKPASVVSRKIKEEYILVPLSSNIADMDSLYRLNATGAFIWDAIDGSHTVSEIIDMVTEAFDAGREEAEHDTMVFLDAIEQFITYR